MLNMYIFIVCKFHINKTDLKWKWDSEKAEILMGVISNLQKMILIHSGGWKLEVICLVSCDLDLSMGKGGLVGLLIRM